MVHLNYNDLNEQAQQRLLDISRKEVERKFGEAIRTYAAKHHSNFNLIVGEEAIRNLYNFSYMFKI